MWIQAQGLGAASWKILFLISGGRERKACMKFSFGLGVGGLPLPKIDSCSGLYVPGWPGLLRPGKY